MGFPKLAVWNARRARKILLEEKDTADLDVCQSLHVHFFIHLRQEYYQKSDHISLE